MHKERRVVPWLIVGLHASIFLLALLTSFAMMIGWGMNAYALWQTEDAVSNWGVLEVARLLGIFFRPLGGLLGWFW